MLKIKFPHFTARWEHLSAIFIIEQSHERTQVLNRYLLCRSRVSSQTNPTISGYKKKPFVKLLIMNRRLPRSLCARGIMLAVAQKPNEAETLLLECKVNIYYMLEERYNSEQIQYHPVQSILSRLLCYLEISL